MTIVLLYLFLVWVRSGGFGKRQESYTIRFENVDGLSQGDPVVIRGYAVGEVEAIQPGADWVEVKIALGTGLDLRQDAYAEIRLREIMGGKQIALFPGREASPLRPGAMLPGRFTADIPATFALVGQMAENIRPEDIRRILLRMDTLSAAASRFAVTLDQNDTGRLVSAMASAATDLQAILHEIRSLQLTGAVSQTLSDGKNTLNMADSALNTINKLAHTAATVTLPGTDSLLNRLNLTLDEASSAMQSLTQLTQKLQSEGSLGNRMLQDPSLSAQLDSVVNNLNRTLDHIRTQKIHVAMSLRHKKRLYQD